MKPLLIVILIIYVINMVLLAVEGQWRGAAGWFCATLWAAIALLYEIRA